MNWPWRSPQISRLGKEGGKGIEREKKSYLRQSKGHQCTNHYHKVEDVPQVSEVGPILQDQALVYHLQEEDMNSHQ